MPNLDTLATEELHNAFLDAMGDYVISHSDITEKPLDLVLKLPLPSDIRLYMYNATQPSGGRPADEYKIQLIVPGQHRSERGAFDTENTGYILLVGYERDLEVFIFWDADLYPDFGYSRNVQVKAETILSALSGELGSQEKNRRGVSNETVFTAIPRMVHKAIEKRIETAIDRILSE